MTVLSPVGKVSENAGQNVFFLLCVRLGDGRGGAGIRGGTGIVSFTMSHRYLQVRGSKKIHNFSKIIQRNLLDK